MIEIQRQMLIIIKEKTGKSGVAICERMGYAVNSIDGWVNKRHEMPISKMHAIIVEYKLNYCEIYYRALERMER